MRLELVNFRCWKKRTFEFRDEGLVLLSGESGAGKTSILLAIYFVLYGTGTKIISFGEKKCSVRFIFNGFDITRTKGPNLLTLTTDSDNKYYENDVAQEIITKRFGTNFTLTSFITQKSVQSFLNLGPTDKMNFLEQLSLGDEDISGIKKRVKERIKEKKEILQQKVGQLELLSAEIGDMKVPEEIDFPLGNKHSDVKIKNEGIYWKRTIKELEEKNISLKKIETEYSREKVSRAVKEKQQSTLDDLDIKKESLSSEIKTLDFEGDEEITELKQTLEFLKNKREFAMNSDRYNEEKKRYEILYDQEIKTLKDEEILLKNKLSSYNKTTFSDTVIKEIESNISLIESINSITKELDIHIQNKLQYEKESGEESPEDKVKILEDKIESLQKEITITEQRVDIKCCPNCKVSLRFNKSTLILADGEPVDEIKSKNEVKRIKAEISSYKTMIDKIKKEVAMISFTESKIKDYKEQLSKKTKPSKTIPELKNELKKLKEDKKEFNELTNQSNIVSTKIKTEDLSQTLKKLKLQVEKRKKDLQSIQEGDELETDYTEEELRSEISKQELLSQKSKSLNKQLSELVSTHKKLSLEID